MTCPSTRAWLLAAALLLPTAAFAQKEPPHTRETKNAEKFMASAMTRETLMERRTFLEQAIEPLRVAMQKDPGNARVWLMAGTIYGGLGDLRAADSAFTKAVQLHPEYGNQVRGERHAAWETAFNHAVQLLNEQKIEEGLAGLQNAEIVFNERPEAQYYLGLFYLQRQQTHEAEAAFQAAIAAVNGPLRPELKESALAEWDLLATSARIKLASAIGNRGAEYYDRQLLDSAAAAFMKARAINPSSRDHLYNHMQSMYAEVLELDKQRATAKSAASDQRAHFLYTSILALSDTLRAIDPRSEDIYFLSSRAHKVLSDLAAETAVKVAHGQSLRAVNSEYEKIPFFIENVQAIEADTTVTISGTVTNKLLESGATGVITFDLVGLDGTMVGNTVVNFVVPADPAAGISFSASVPVSAPLAGWRYSVR